MKLLARRDTKGHAIRTSADPAAQLHSRSEHILQKGTGVLVYLRTSKLILTSEDI